MSANKLTKNEYSLILHVLNNLKVGVKEFSTDEKMAETISDWLEHVVDQTITANAEDTSWFYEGAVKGSC